MSVRDIIEFPDPLLKKNARDVKSLNQEVKKLIEDMTDTMYHAPGIGLAANQIGEMQKIAVADVSSKDEPKKTIVIVNPRIVDMSEETETMEEGCLSVPEFSSEVERALWITVAGKNMKGEDIEFTARDLLARVLQHEIDHLNGVLYIDRIGKLKRYQYVRQRKKTLAENKDK